MIYLVCISLDERVESGERSDCWYAGTIHGNNWENSTYEVILCPKTKEDYFSEYR